MAIIVLNGKNYVGENLSIIGNQVYSDGKLLNPEDEKEINISVEGNIEELKIGYCNSLNIKGDVHSAQSNSGNINVEGNIRSNVRTSSGDVKCKEIVGDVQTTSGDVKVKGNISGKTTTVSGDIKFKK